VLCRSARRQSLKDQTVATEVCMLEVLTDINWINLLPDKVQQEIRSHMQRRTFRKGELLHRKGDPATHIYEILRGKMRMCSISTEGKEFWVDQFDAGDTFGEQRFIDNRNRSHTVVAQTDCEVALLLRDDFDALCSRYHEIYRALLIVNIEYVRTASELLEDIGMTGVRQRLAKLLCKLAARYGISHEEGIIIDIEISQDNFGNLIGASRQSISKALFALRQEKIIETRRQKLIINNLDKLQSRI